MEEIKKAIFKDIYIVINKIKKCKSKSIYSTLINELATLYNLCDNFDITDYPELGNYSYKSIEYDNKENNYAYEVFKNIDYHLEFAESNQIIDCKYNNPNSFVIKNFFPSSNYLDIICDFLEKYDPKLLKIFNDMLIEGRILVSGSSKTDNDIHTPAYTACSYGSFKPYIVLEQENCIADLVNLVHELAHTQEYLNSGNISNKIKIQKEHNCLEEVYSYFLQNLFILYLDKIKFCMKDIETIKLGYNYTFYKYIEDLWQSLIDINEKQILNIQNMTDYLNYTYGIAIGYHFIDRYLKDPEKAKKEIDSFIILNGQYDMMEMLEKFNLKDELINSKVLKKYL